jgi:hypothetical protein
MEQQRLIIVIAVFDENLVALVVGFVCLNLVLLGPVVKLTVDANVWVVVKHVEVGR